MLEPLNAQIIEPIVRAALVEDTPWGDITSQTFVPASTHAVADLVARQPGVLSGGLVFAAVMSLTDTSSKTVLLKQDGTSFTKGETLATVSGPARSLLQAERVALNFVQRLSGIATLTSQHVAAIAGTKARIVDTRKTTPGLRQLERYAVRCGGGFNHRFSLSDAVMVKDNHLAALRQETPGSLTHALLTARQKLPHTVHVEVEVDRPDQIEEVLAAGVDTILLDNFTVEQLRSSVEQIAGRALVEASGSIRLETVADVARTGVDIISIGALTHSVPSLDLGLDFRVSAAR
jgi:nicotinate-nucleotide pyrophosphorylase (carboxylating)